MSAPLRITTGVIRRTVPPTAAVAAPVTAALAVASFHAHSSDVPRQLDYIKADVPGFTGMVLLENASSLCVALVGLAVATRVAGRGSLLALAGAVLTVLGMIGGVGGFGAALPVLARQTDRTAAVHFADHPGPIYGVNGALAAGLLLGLLLTLGATWRAGYLRWWHSAIFVGGVVLLTVANAAPLLMVAAFAVMTVPMGALARFLWQPPSPRPSTRVLAEAGAR